MKWFNWFAAVLSVRCVSGLVQNYCSSENTGSEEVTNTWQSNGYCSDYCRGKSYDYAIVQDYSCWCSNDLPSSDEPVSSCSHICPGYSVEHCGNPDSGLYGYLYLGSGTPPSITSSSGSSGSSSTGTFGSSTSGQGGSTTLSSSGTSSSSVTTSTASTLVETTATSASGDPDESALTSTNPGTRTTTSASTSKATTTTLQPSVSVIISIATITAQPTGSGKHSASGSDSNQVITTKVITTVYSTPSAAAGIAVNTNHGKSGDGEVSNKSHSGFWDSAGKVAGTFTAVGVVVVLLLIALVILFMRYRRRKEQQDFEKTYDVVKRSATDAYSTSISSQNDPSGNSSTGMAPFVYADEKGILTPTVKNLSLRPVTNSGNASSVSTPASATAPTSATGNPPTPSSPTNGVGIVPNSTDAVVLDQRLDPQHLMSQWESNGSRLSLADDVDYSRKVLRVINE
ncbi:hypothetical protein C6P43_004862 [Kluyveromyces marxianus]|nr:hypothetical protein C6P43_004862 [Kluyveromyces marxianus]